jgi:hypothetical protein
MKRTIPLLITALGGFVLIIAYFIPHTESWGDEAAIWFDVLAAIAFVLGGGNLMKMNLQKVSDRRPGWGYAGVVVLAFLITLIIGLGKVGVNPAENYPNLAWSGSYREIGSPFWWIYEYAFRPLTATMFAMLAFYVASAAFRAFRAKNLEATLLLGTAFIILLGRTFAGVWLTDWIPENSVFAGLRFENITVYIMSVFNTAGNRAIMIGIALGLVSVSLKVMLGVDRSYLGKE